MGPVFQRGVLLVLGIVVAVAGVVRNAVLGSRFMRSTKKILPNTLLGGDDDTAAERVCVGKAINQQMRNT
jgi:hypothetical protein